LAAELSTGALALAAVETSGQPVAMLITGLRATFEKKATALTTFTCENGPEVFAAVDRALGPGGTAPPAEPATVEMENTRRAPDGTVVARLTFTWSFKRRSTR